MPLVAVTPSSAEALRAQQEQVNRFTDALHTLLFGDDPRTGRGGLLTVLGAAPVAAAVGRAKPSPRLVEIAKALLARISGETGLSGVDPEAVARAVHGTKAAALRRYRPAPSTPEVQPPPSRGYLVRPEDLENVLWLRTMHALRDLGDKPLTQDVVTYLWKPLSGAARTYARRVMSHTTVPESDTLEREVARLKSLYSRRADELTLDLLLRELRARRPSAMARPGAEERVVRFLHSAAPHEEALDKLPTLPTQEASVEAAERAVVGLKLMKAMDTLPARQKTVLSMFYGLTGDPPKSLSEIARTLAEGKVGAPLSERTLKRDLAAARETLARAVGRHAPPVEPPPPAASPRRPFVPGSFSRYVTVTRAKLPRYEPHPSGVGTRLVDPGYTEVVQVQRQLDPEALKPVDPSRYVVVKDRTTGNLTLVKEE